MRARRVQWRSADDSARSDDGQLPAAGGADGLTRDRVDEGGTDDRRTAVQQVVGKPIGQEGQGLRRDRRPIGQQDRGCAFGAATGFKGSRTSEGEAWTPSWAGNDVLRVPNSHRVTPTRAGSTRGYSSGWDSSRKIGITRSVPSWYSA